VATEAQLLFLQQEEDAGLAFGCACLVMMDWQSHGQKAWGKSAVVEGQLEGEMAEADGLVLVVPFAHLSSGR